MSESEFAIPHFRLAGFLTVLMLSVALLGVITLRLSAVSRGVKPRFRSEIMAVLRRWPTSVIATVAALGFPMLLYTVWVRWSIPCFRTWCCSSWGSR